MTILYIYGSIVLIVLFLGIAWDVLTVSNGFLAFSIAITAITAVLWPIVAIMLVYDFMIYCYKSLKEVVKRWRI